MQKSSSALQKVLLWRMGQWSHPSTRQVIQHWGCSISHTHGKKWWLVQQQNKSLQYISSKTQIEVLHEPVNLFHLLLPSYNSALEFSRLHVQVGKPELPERSIQADTRNALLAQRLKYGARKRWSKESVIGRQPLKAIQSSDTVRGRSMLHSWV